MGQTTHTANGDESNDQQLTTAHRRAMRDRQRFEDYIARAAGDHLVQEVKHANGNATVWVITEGLDSFVIEMFNRSEYELVDHNSDRATAAFVRKITTSMDHRH